MKFINASLIFALLSAGSNANSTSHQRRKEEGRYFRQSGAVAAMSSQETSQHEKQATTFSATNENIITNKNNEQRKLESASDYEYVLSIVDSASLGTSAYNSAIQYAEFMETLIDVLNVLEQNYGTEFLALKEAVLSEDLTETESALSDLLNRMTSTEASEMSDAAKSLQDSGAGSLLIVFSGSVYSGLTISKDYGVAINLDWLLFPSDTVSFVDSSAPLASIFTASGVAVGLSFDTGGSIDFLVGYHTADPSGVGGPSIDLSLDVTFLGSVNMAFGFDASTVSISDPFPDLVCAFAATSSDVGVGIDGSLGVSYADVILQFCGDGSLITDSDSAVSAVSPFPLFNGGGVEESCNEADQEDFWKEWSTVLGITCDICSLTVDRSDEGWVYVINPENDDFPSHEALANNCGGHLASVESLDEMNIVNFLALTNDVSDELWMGGRQTNTAWGWLDGSDWSYADTQYTWTFQEQIWILNWMMRQASTISCTSEGCEFDSDRRGCECNSYKHGAVYILPAGYEGYGNCDTTNFLVNEFCPQQLSYEEPCTYNLDCTSGYCNQYLSTPLCDDVKPGLVLSLCENDDDCGGKKVCSSGQCKKISGKKCTKNKECDSGFCFGGISFLGINGTCM